MTNYMTQNTEHVQLPSARERLAELRAGLLPHKGEPWASDRIFILNVADILLDAMRDGPDMGRVVERMKKPEGKES